MSHFGDETYGMANFNSNMINMMLPRQMILFGILEKQWPLSNLLNYFIIIGKLFLWDSRRSQTLPKIQGFQSKIKNKVSKKDFFKKKMVACSYIVNTRYNCYCKLENPVNMCYTIN